MIKNEYVEEINFEDYRKILSSQEKLNKLKEKCSEGDIEKFKEFFEFLISNLSMLKKVNTEMVNLIEASKKEELLVSLEKQFKEVVAWVVEAGNFKTLLKQSIDGPYIVEVNGDVFEEYKGENIELFRIETNNLFVYIDSEYTISDVVTVFDNDGNMLGDFKLSEMKNIKNAN